MTTWDTYIIAPGADGVLLHARLGRSIARVLDRSHAGFMFAVDYVYFSNRVHSDGDESHKITLIVMRDSRTGSYEVSTDSSKGVDVAPVSYAVGFIRLLGHRRIVFQTGDDPAIKARKRAVARHLTNDCDVMTRKSLDSEWYGLCCKPRCTQSFTHPIVSWLLRHSPALLFRYRRGVDELTGESRRIGRPWRQNAVNDSLVSFIWIRWELQERGRSLEC